MSSLTIKPAGAGKYDLLALGEIMLRLDPGKGAFARRGHSRFGKAAGNTMWLAGCGGVSVLSCDAFAENDIGRLLEDFILQGGVETEFVKWLPFDGIGRAVRNGLNFTERGFGVRGALGIPDRGHSAASQLKSGDFDWEHILKLGVRWFHTGGIFAALSETTSKLVLEAVQAARKHGTIVSYDLNYRPSLWKSIGGQKKAQEVNREIARYVDVMLGNEEDFTACLGFKVQGMDDNISSIDVSAFKAMIGEVVREFPKPAAHGDDLASGKIGHAEQLGCDLLERREILFGARAGGYGDFGSRGRRR